MSGPSDTPAAAEAEAETARAGLASTFSQLRENLKPANVVDEMMSSAKVNAAAITDQVWDTARKNPFPALMIGAGLAMIFGVGTKYGLSSGRSSSTLPTRPYRYGDGVRSTGSTALPDPSGPTAGGFARAKDTAAAAKGQAQDLLGTANDRLGAAASRGVGLVSQAYASAKRSNPMSISRQTVSSSLHHLIDEQPLILAAVGVAIGAALGAALPQTQVENSLMGETSGNVRDTAQGMVEDQIAQVKAAAAHAVDDIKQSVAQHGVNAENLSGLVQDIGERAKSATYEAGRAVNPQS